MTEYALSYHQSSERAFSERVIISCKSKAKLKKNVYGANVSINSNLLNVNQSYDVHSLTKSQNRKMKIKSRNEMLNEDQKNKEKN